jgi:predicted acetyltransferase
VTTTRLVPEEDWEAARLLALEAFGGPGNPERFHQGMPLSTPVGTYDGGRLVAWARVKPYAQWFGGRAVPMAGLSG